MTPTLLLVAALQLPAAPPPKTDAKPLGPAPRIMLLNREADGKVRIQAQVTEIRKVNVSKSVNGQVERTTEDREYKRLVDVPVSELEKLTVYTADGKELNRATALEKLASGGLVVVTTDGEKVDPTYLKAFKDDMLVLVSPQLIGTPVRPTPALSTAVRAAPAVIQVLPLLPAARPAAAPPPAEKKVEKKDDKKEPPKKDEKKS